jgi:hypothetical protein
MSKIKEKVFKEILQYADSGQDDKFGYCLQTIKQFLFPEEKYQCQLEAYLRNLDRENDPESRVSKTNQKIAELVKHVCQVNPDDSEEPTLPLPFLEHFHQLFLRRQWTIPYKDPGASDSSHHLVRLKPDKKSEAYYSTEYNYSKNCGDYNHFVNVVAALARLIIYFSRRKTTKKIVNKILEQSEFPKENEKTEFYQELQDVLIYNKTLDFRTFKLMLAGFYHDIGKSIEYARHAMEGAIILASHTTYSRSKLNDISQLLYQEKFERNDLLFIADLVLYHDQYGTLSTGEDGYLQLVDIIDRIFGYTLKYSDKLKARRQYSAKYIFDLWLLNVADIMVSLENKFEIQEEWNKHEDAIKKIEQFFDFEGKSNDKANNLIHDFQITLHLLDEYCSHVHVDDLGEIKSEAHKISRTHATERLQRLITNTLEKAGRDWQKEIDKKIEALLLQAIAPKLLDKINRENVQLSEEEQLSENEKEIRSAIKGLVAFIEDNDNLPKIKQKLSKCQQQLDDCGENSQKINQTSPAKAAIEIIKEIINESNIQNGEKSLLKKGVEENQKEWIESQGKKDTILKILKPINALQMKKIIDYLHKLPRSTWNSIIVGRIKSIGNREDFFNRFSWVKKSDYALGFFQELAKEALKYAKEEVEDQPSAYRTGWLSISDVNYRLSESNFEYFNQAQAQFFADNYAMTVIQILNHLLFRESSIDSPRNVEFSDAKKRLTKEKKKQILSLEGPCRSMSSIDLILQTIYIY